jgi:hypothetical protein
MTSAPVSGPASNLKERRLIGQPIRRAILVERGCVGCCYLNTWGEPAIPSVSLQEGDPKSVVELTDNEL